MSDCGLAQAPIRMRIATEPASPDPLPVLAEKFKELAEEKTGGRVQITLYTGGVLGNQSELQEQIVLGTIESIVTASTMPELHPSFGLFDFPFLFANREHVYAVLDGEVGQRLNDILLQSTGVRVLGYGELGFRHITNNVRPIYTPADLRGVKIRVPSNRLRIEAFKALGAAPTPVPWGELYTALQQGVVDGQENPLEAIVGASLDEVQRFLTVSYHVYTPAYLLVTESWWSGLPADIRQQLQEAADEAVAWQREFGARSDATILAQLEAVGLEINELDAEAFAEAARVVWDQFAHEVGADLVALAQSLRP